MGTEKRLVKGPRKTTYSIFSFSQFYENIQLKETNKCINSLDRFFSVLINFPLFHKNNR